MVSNDIKLNTANKTVTFDEKLFRDEFILRVEKDNKRFKVSVGTLSNMNNVIDLNDEYIKEGYFFGIEGAQNEGITVMKVNGIRYYKSEDVKSEDKSEKRSFGIIVWLIFIGIGLLLGYYCYQNYMKYK